MFQQQLYILNRKEMTQWQALLEIIRSANRVWKKQIMKSFNSIKLIIRVPGRQLLSGASGYKAEQTKTHSAEGGHKQKTQSSFCTDRRTNRWLQCKKNGKNVCDSKDNVLSDVWLTYMWRNRDSKNSKGLQVMIHAFHHNRKTLQTHFTDISSLSKSRATLMTMHHPW